MDLCRTRMMQTPKKWRKRTFTRTFAHYLPFVVIPRRGSATISHFRMDELAPCGWEIQVSSLLSISFRVSFLSVVALRKYSHMQTARISRSENESANYKASTYSMIDHFYQVSTLFNHGMTPIFISQTKTRLNV